MVQIIWTAQALQDLENIKDFIARDSYKFAEKQVLDILVSVDLLITNPKLGKKVIEIENNNIREIIEGNYRIIYQFKPSEIQILLIHHSARNLQQRLK